jgi:mannitol-specific phosphotransferase system IIBC component
MRTVFRYFLLLSVIIIPLFVLLEENENKFPILMGAFFGVTVSFWVAILIMKIREKKREGAKARKHESAKARKTLNL